MSALSNLITIVGMELSALEELRLARERGTATDVAKLRAHADYMSRQTAAAFAAWQRETAQARS